MKINLFQTIFLDLIRLNLSFWIFLCHPRDKILEIVI